MISQITEPISKIQTPFDRFNSPVREISKNGVSFDLEVIDNVTGQVKVGMFDFSGLMTSTNKMSVLSGNKTN